MRQILVAGVKPDQWSAALRRVIPDGSLQHRIASFQRIENRLRCYGLRDPQNDLIVDSGQAPQMERKRDSNHGSVCTSTDNTLGKSRTIGDQ